jgi:hypothetical protein
MAASSSIGKSAPSLRVRIRIAVPPQGLGRQIAEMQAWLDAVCGADSWAISPAGLNGVINDALAIDLPDAALARAFVARWCLGYRSYRPR